MNLNFRKTALLAGICSVFSLGYAPQLFAVSSTDTVEAVQQTKKITGVVSDAMGPIIGANVLEKGTTNGVITDIDGNFALNVKPGATIVVSFIGYVSQEIKITNQTTVNITLKEDSEMLDEVVVVGYGTMKKSDLSGLRRPIIGHQYLKLQPFNAHCLTLQGAHQLTAVTIINRN